MVNLVKNKLFICKEWHIQPSEIDRLQYFDYETMLEEIDQQNKEQEKRNKEEQKQYQQMNSSMKNMNNYNNITKQAQQSLPKVQLPKFN
jgi:hypothetical protein